MVVVHAGLPQSLPGLGIFPDEPGFPGFLDWYRGLANFQSVSRIVLLVLFQNKSWWDVCCKQYCCDCQYVYIISRSI